MSEKRKPLYFMESYSARKCITKCPNCYKCKGNCKNNKQVSKSPSQRPSIANLKIKDKYPFILEYQNGIYQGDLSNFLKENFGIFFSDDSLFYLGSWKNDQISGKGYLFFPKGGYLYAHYEKNKINGPGILNYPNGNRLIGYWNRSKMHGPFFHYYEKNKLWVLCEYVDGLLMRYGKEEFSENIPSIMSEYPEIRKIVETIFKEDFVKDFKRDQASEEDIRYLKLTKDLKYIGFSKKKIPNGLGIVFHKHLPLFYGLFKDGVLDGLGRMNLENGDIYEGFFKDGMFNGVGVYYNKKNDNYIYGSFQKNICVNKTKNGSKYPLNLITNLKKEEHKKSIKYFNKTFNFALMSLGGEFSDENFLEEACKSSIGGIYNFPIEKPTRKPLENVEIVQKSSSKDIHRTQVVEVHTNLTPKKRIFNETEFFQDMIKGKFYQFPRNCLDFYDNNIDSFEVISQNNNVYNLSGDVKRIIMPRRAKINYYQPIVMYETAEDNFKVWKEETATKNNFFKETLKKNETMIKTVKKNNKENSFEYEPKESSEILFLKKSNELNKKLEKTRNFFNNEIFLDPLNEFSQDGIKEISRISSIRLAEKIERSENRKLLKSYHENMNSNELNDLSDHVYLKMSKQRGIFDISEEEFPKLYNEKNNIFQKSINSNKKNLSSHEIWKLNRSKQKNKSYHQIFQDENNEFHFNV